MSESDKHPWRDALSWVDDDGARRPLELGPGREWTIGRAPDCDVHLPDRRVSRRHARLADDGQGLMIEDLDSRGGVWVNGIKVRRARLCRGDVVRVGGARILFDAEDETLTDVLVEVGTRADLEPADLERDGADRAADSPAASRSPVAGEAAPDSPGPAAEPDARIGAGRARARRRASSPLRKAAAIVLALAALVAAGLWLESRLDFGSSRRTPPAGTISGDGGELTRLPGDPAARGAGVDLTAPGGGAPSTAGSEVAETVDEYVLAENELRAILERVEAGEDVVDIREELQGVLDRHPETFAAVEAGRFLVVLGASERAAQARDERARARGDAALEREVGGGRLSQAALGARLLAETSSRPEQREFWAERAAELGGEAIEELRRLGDELSGLSEAGRTDEALRVLLDRGTRLRGLEEYQLLVPSYLEAALAGVRKRAVVTGLLTAEVVELRNRAAVAFDYCRFGELVALRNRLLAVELDGEERADALEGLLRAVYWQRMFEDFLASAATETIEVPLPSGPARIVAADENEVTLEVGEGEVTARVRRAWHEMSPESRYRVFRAARLRRDGTLGLALYALEKGDEDQALRTLLRLHRSERSRALAEGVLARHRRMAVPPDGFVEFEGRLVTSAEKVAFLAARRQRAEDTRAERKRLRAVGVAEKLAGFLTRATEMRRAGRFSLAQAILTEIIRSFARSPMAERAQELATDPLLRVRPVHESGAPANRLDIHILGDGYPYDDEYQEGFENSAALAVRLVTKARPFREYQSYLNVWAVNTGSSDRGLDREPGGVERDTALGGKVTYDRFGVDRENVMAVLKRLGEPGEDRQAVVIGNDYAGVSTGGGGVASCAKASLLALVHEMGHSLAGLHDEYEREPGTDPKRGPPPPRRGDVETKPRPPNLVEGSDRDDALEAAPWRHWIDAHEDAVWNGAEVAAFEGGGLRPFDIWRPQADCRMRNASSEFCVVCMERMVLSIYRYVRPIDRVEPDDGAVELARSGSVEVRLWPMKPESHFLEVRWFLQKLASAEAEKVKTGKGGGQGETVVVEKHPEKPVRTVYRRYDAEGRVVEIALLRGRNLDPGRYRLRAVVRDPTPWVLKDPQGRLRQEREWTVVVK